MTRGTERESTVREMSLRDFGTALPSLIPDDRVVLLADFDETLCSTYDYDPTTKAHRPNIDPRILLEAQRMQSQLFIATSRSSNELAVSVECASLVEQKGLPIICENGAVLFFPRDSQRVILATSDQVERVNQIKRDIRSIQTGPFLKDRELVIRDNRIATIEMRIQHANGMGDPTLYGELIEMLSGGVDLSDLDLVTSGSSLSVQPKGINKGTAFLRALSLMGLERSGFFVVGLGDAPNDREIFEQADLGIGVRKEAGPYSDIIVNEGDKATLLLMKRLN